MLLVAEAKGILDDEIALGPVFSSQVWSTIWLAIDWPRSKPSFGARRCRMWG